MQSKIAREKICLIFLGESQTGKSSMINTFAQKMVAKTGKFGEGKSCTLSPECYGPYTSRSGCEILLVDTKGFNDNRFLLMETEESQLTNLQAVLASFVQQITQFGAQRIYLIFTESLESDTSQIARNYVKMMQLFGENSIKSSILVATKYNPQDTSPLYQVRVKNRMQALNQQLDEIYNETQIRIPMVKFHTELWGDDKNLIQKLSDQDMIRQEQELFQTLFHSAVSYPVRIFEDYNNWCVEKKNELLNTVGVGLVEFEEPKITYKKSTKHTYFKQGRYFLGIIRIGTKTVDVPYEVQEPIINYKKKTKQIKDENDIVNLFMRDQKYKDMRHQKLRELFKKYDI